MGYRWSLAYALKGNGASSRNSIPNSCSAPGTGPYVALFVPGIRIRALALEGQLMIALGERCTSDTCKQRYGCNQPGDGAMHVEEMNAICTWIRDPDLDSGCNTAVSNNPDSPERKVTTTMLGWISRRENFCKGQCELDPSRETSHVKPYPSVARSLRVRCSRNA